MQGAHLLIVALARKHSGPTVIVITTQTIDKNTWFLSRNSNREKSRGGKFTITREFTGITGIGWCVLSFDWVEGKWFILAEEKVYFYWTVDGEWELTMFMHFSTCKLVVMIVIMSVRLLGLHVGNIFTVHNYFPLMLGYTFSMWERGCGVIADQDLSGRYWRLPWWNREFWTVGDSVEWCLRNRR